MKKIHRFIINSNLLLFVCSVIFALFLMEGIIRVFHLSPEVISFDVYSKKSGYMSSPNRILGYTLKPNYRNENATLHRGSFPETNSHGQRDVERTYEKPDGRRRIVLLGDSVVAGHGIYDLNDTISRQLEALIPPQENVEVLNLGVGGYQTLAESELLRIKGVKYGPDLVILMFEYNDFGEKNNDIFYFDTPRILGVSSRWFFKTSHLFRFLVMRVNFLGMKFYFDPEYRMKSHIQALENSVEKGIARMAALARKHDFELIVAVWPRFPKFSSGEPVSQDFCEAPGRCERLEEIEKICVMQKLGLYSMAGFFLQDYKRLAASAQPVQGDLSPRKKYTIGDGCHPNPYGAGIAAQGLLEILYRRNFLSPVHRKK